MYPKFIRHQYGAATLMLTIILMLSALLVMFYMSSNSVLQQKTTTNEYTDGQAFQAAEAGQEFGIAYLKTNRSTIVGSASGGVINYGGGNSSLTNVSQSDGSFFSIVYTNPTVNNFNLIQITATGTSSDSTSTQTVNQLYQYASLLATIPTNPSSVAGAVSLSGSSAIGNTEGNYSIISGGAISFNGNAGSSAQSGSSGKTGNGPDVQANNPALGSMTPDQFFQSYFGVPSNTVKSMVSNYYAAGSNPNLSGVTGASIWVDDALSLTSNMTIGSSTSPVILIVNGNFSMNGGVTIYGFVFVFGSVSTIGNTEIIGGFASIGALSMSGNSAINYNGGVLNGAANSIGTYAKVPGSWRDF